MCLVVELFLFWPRWVDGASNRRLLSFTCVLLLSNDNDESVNK
jgi:hypothetical protein